jgi:DNA anti-recombination protein RmuC
MVRRCEKIPGEAIFMRPGESLKQVFFATNNLRHLAVHRRPTRAKEVHQLVRSAQKLAQTLGDVVRTTQLAQVSAELERRIEELETQVNVLENRLDQQHQGIIEQRAELDKQEAESTTAMFEQAQEHKMRIGSFLEATVKTIFKVIDKPAAQPVMQMNGTLDDGEEDETKIKLDLAEPGEERSANVQPEFIDLTGD